MNFIVPPRLKSGDKVAIVAPSSGAAAMFPWVKKQGLKRMQEIFGLEPIEFPTVANINNSPADRAKDINEAFANQEIKAIVAAIGGDDQIKVIPYLDKNIIAKNPKIFVGLSDNTNLHLFLWNLGILSYYGGNLMQQWAMNGKMDDYTVEYFKKALFENEIGEIKPSQEWNDVDFEWADESLLSKEKPQEKNPGWVWHNADGKQVNGRLWGGCWEIIAWQMEAQKYLPNDEELKDTILFMETSEEMPRAEYVYRSLVAMGIRGWLANFKAILIGRPKTQHRGQLPREGREKFLENQKGAIIEALKEYAPELPAVFGLDFGHTDPQLLVPNGAIAEIDGNQKKIYFK